MKKRILAMIIDYLIILAICEIPLIIYTMVKDFNIFEALNSIITIVIILTIFKDLMFRNASIGKKIMRLEIRGENNKIPNVSTIILRNITLVLWPLEGIILLITNKRIGDIIFNTKVVEMNDLNKKNI